MKTYFFQWLQRKEETNLATTTLFSSVVNRLANIPTSTQTRLFNLFVLSVMYVLYNINSKTQ